MINNFSAPFNGTSLVNSTSPSVYITFHKSLAILCGTVVTINICGAFANGVTLLATITYPPLRQSSSWILLAHCILLDYLNAQFIAPGLILVTYLGAWPFPAYFCRIWGGVSIIITLAGDWSHAVLAVNRFIAVVLPHHYRPFTTRKMLSLAVAFPWLMACALNVNPVAGLAGVLYQITKPFAGCLPFPANAMYNIEMIALGVYLPSVMIGISYITVLVKAKISLRMRTGLEGGEVGRRSVLKKRYEVSKILFLCFLWFCVSNFANPIAYSYFPVPFLGSPLTQLAIKGLQDVSSAVNPVSSKCRIKWKDSIQCFCMCRVATYFPAEMETALAHAQTHVFKCSMFMR